MQENEKIIRVRKDGKQPIRTRAIWQYDVGHVLQFEGFELPETFQVHFALSMTGEATTQIGQDDACALPPMYTQSSGTVYAWVYVADEEAGLTKQAIEIPVEYKAEPTDQEPTPVQESAVDQAIAALNGGVTRAETAAEAAEAAQEAAEGYAESAGNSAITATNAASSAGSAAGVALAAAQAAGSSATDANASREAADVSATNAGVSERNAAVSATAAAGSATSAAASAGQAGQSAEAAAGSATAAGTAKAGAESAQEAAEGSAQAAAGSATAAAGSATQAAGSATAAGTAKTGAESAQQAAAGSATAAAGSATQAAGSAAAAAGSAAAAAQTVAGIEAAGAAQIAAIEDKGEEVLESIPADYSEMTEDVSSLKSAINELPDIYAKQDGTYEDLTAGNALEVLSDRGTSDTEPYLFRKAVGWNRAKLNAVTGGTVAWNQAILALERDNWIEESGVSATFSDGVVTLSSTTNNNGIIKRYKQYTAYAGHKYFVQVEAKGSAGQSCRMLISGRISCDITFSQSDTWERKTIITNNAEGRTGNIYLFGVGTYSNVSFRNVLFFDLTQMFGSAVADYIYSVEQSTPGAGVSLFRSWFPNDYYEYNPGELISVSGLQSRDTVGFNQWDEEWELGGINETTGQKEINNNFWRAKNMIRVIPGSVYYPNFPSHSGYFRIYYYDADKNYLRYASIATNYTFTVPDDAHYIYFRWSATHFADEIGCINLSDPSRNGTYKPYVKHSYPLDSDLVLRGIPKLVDNKLAFDGDRYLPDGTVERRCGIVDLGTLNWVKPGAYFRAEISDKNHTSESGVIELLLTAKYIAIASSVAASTMPDKTMKGSNGQNNWTNIYITDSDYDNAADFKASLSGQYLVYELAEPTTETAAPYRNLQIQEKGGTEAFISNATLPVPVGHETFYPINVFDYIDQAIAAALNA